MSHYRELIAELRARGHRLTPQREMVLEIIHDSPGHVTAEEIYQQVQQRSSAINLGTVYRILELLRQERLVTATDLGAGCAQYELAQGEGHHHLVCSDCGATLSIPHEEIQPLQEQLEARYGWQVALSHLAIFGICPECARQPKAAA